MRTIIVVDDNTTLAYFTARSLQQNLRDVEVITASSCQEARAKARWISPSVVIADMKLPDGDGLELIREFSKQFPDIKAIVTTGADVTEALQGGLAGFLKKPYGEKLLLSVVRRAAGLTGPTDSVPLDDQVGQGQSVQPFVYDSHHVRNRLSALLAGLRALQADLRADADNPSALRQMADVHVERLFEIAVELADIMKQGSDK